LDPYQPQQWHDFFFATSGAAAALTGLLFVSLSLHMRFIATQPVYRHMASGSLVGLVTALVQSLLVLVSQPAQWLAIEFAAVGFAYVAGVGGQQLFSLRRAGWQIPRSSAIRSIIGYALGLIGLATGIGMAFKVGPGLYVVGLIAVSIMLWSLWNTWLLVIGIADEEIEADDKAG